MRLYVCVCWAWCVHFGLWGWGGGVRVLAGSLNSVDSFSPAPLEFCIFDSTHAFMIKVTCGAELAVLFVESLVKGKIPCDDETIGQYFLWCNPFSLFCADTFYALYAKYIIPTLGIVIFTISGMKCAKKIDLLLVICSRKPVTKFCLDSILYRWKV